MTRFRALEKIDWASVMKLAKAKIGSPPVPKTASERQAEELAAAGWKQTHRNVWERPDRALFLGPHQAWKVMKQQAQSGSPEHPQSSVESVRTSGVGIQQKDGE